jgi:broad specificity phosphatase PhoE
VSTNVLLLRHERNEGDRLHPEGVARARKTGAALHAAGIDLAAVVSSPRWRCIETVRWVLEGGSYPLVLEAVDARLGDLALDPVIPRRARERILTRAEALGVAKGKVMLERSPNLRPHFRRRGLEGSAVLLDLVARHAGKTILVCTHGGSRLEPVVCTLAAASLARPPYYFARGGLARLVFEDRVLRHHHYLGVPAELPPAAFLTHC